MSKTISLEVEVNTSPLQKRLKLVAKHLNNLADDLDKCDYEENEVQQYIDDLAKKGGE